MTHVPHSEVAVFFDTHPINEDEILAKLRASGKDLDALSQSDLGDLDQDHYGGQDAVEELAKGAGVSRGDRVLDVCSGMGGPARWLASRIGCRVTGIDLTRSRVEGATRLTRRVGLDAWVDFVEGDATKMPFPDATFNVIIAQEAWCHIGAKPALISEVGRVLVPGGRIAFTDIVTVGPLSAEEEARLAATMHMPRPATVQEYLGLLASHRFERIECVDLSAPWRNILVGRLAMYRSLRDTTIAKFGEARFAEYDAAYSAYVDLFLRGKLGGCRICATRA